MKAGLCGLPGPARLAVRSAWQEQGERKHKQDRVSHGASMRQALGEGKQVTPITRGNPVRLAHGSTIANMRTTCTARLNPIVVIFAISCGGGGLGASGNHSGGAGGTLTGGTGGAATSTAEGGAGGSGGVSGTGGATKSTVQGGAGGSGGAAGTGGAGTAIDGGGPGGVGGTSACTKITCAADFPCSASGYSAPRCIVGDPSSISVGRDVSCAEVCGTPCCSGGSCRMEAQACSAGTVCVYSPPNTRQADCVDQSQTCGGSLGKTCAPTEYCEYFGAACPSSSTYCTGQSDACKYVAGGAHGLCRTVPSGSQCANPTLQVCGCDGITYKNDCARMAANTAQAHTGACP